MTAHDVPDAELGAPGEDAPAGASDPAPEETVIAARRRAPQPADEATEIAVRRRATDVDPDDATAPARRGAASPPVGDVEDEDADEDDTVLSRRAAPQAADTAPEIEDTVLRPARASSSSPEDGSGIVREALIPDAAALRMSMAPRPEPPAVVERSPISPRRTDDGVAAPVPDHESVERAVRARARRRALIVVLCATAGAVAATAALVLLLT